MSPISPSPSPSLPINNIADRRSRLATHGSLPAGTHDELLENGHGELSGDEHSHEIHSEDEFAEHEEYVHSDDEEEHLQCVPSHILPFPFSIPSPNPPLTNHHPGWLLTALFPLALRTN